jgi:hypothetical protein
MDHMGHDSVRTVMIYQHKTASANEAIAQATDERIKKRTSQDRVSELGRRR